jgi:hypothetical protein
MHVGKNEMASNNFTSLATIALLWIFTFIEGLDYFRNGEVHLKVGFVDGLPAAVILGLLAFFSLLFTFWFFHYKKRNR